jgi:hypothetical protein
MIESFTTFVKFLNLPDLYHNNWILKLDQFKVGSRLTLYNDDPWHFLGFFQLWNPTGSHIYTYPSNTDASKSDIEFSKKFHRNRRALLPECISVHLEEGESQLGKNWQGRSTPHFGN